MPTAFESLLVVQGHDITIDQLRYRREHLPARSMLADALAAAKALMPKHAVLSSEVHLAQLAERKLDDEVQLVRDKANDVNVKLYSGTVTASKELQALQLDLEGLNTKIAKLEDAELEAMSQREDLEAALADVTTKLGELQATVQRADAEIVAGEAEVEALLVEEQQRRAEAAATISASLLADYETRRTNNRGQGAARLIGDTCQACRLSIPATEVDQVRHDSTGTAWYCDNCGAILVVTHD